MIKPKVYETNMMLLNAKTEEELKMLVAQTPAIGTVVDRLELISSDTKFQHQALVREKAIRDHYSSLSTAERRGDKGIIKGRIEIAKNMLNKKISLEDINEMTGLSIEQIKNIKY